MSSLLLLFLLLSCTELLWTDGMHIDAGGGLHLTRQMRCCRQSCVSAMTEKAFPATACRGNWWLLPIQASFEQAEA